MTSPEPGSRRVLRSRHGLLGVDSDGTAPASHRCWQEGSHHGNHPHRRRFAVPVWGRRLLLEQQARVAPEQRSLSTECPSMARPPSDERTRPLQAVWSSPSWGRQESLVPESQLRAPRRHHVAVALAGASWAADTGLPEVLICCGHHETSLRQVLLSGRGFCACRRAIVSSWIF